MVFLVVCGLAAVGFWVFRTNSLEDAYITFRYARHLAAGFGYGAWNLDGTRVDGSTTFLWTWWMAGGFRIGVPPLVWSSLSSYAFLLTFLAVLLFAAARSFTTPDDPFDQVTRRRAAFLLAAYAPLHWYATSGMEAVAFMALGGLVLLFALSRKRWASVGFAACAVLLVLTRPEGILLLVAALVAPGRAGRLSSLLPGILVAVAAAIALALYRRYTFGDWVPNTYYAKASGFSPHRILLGLQYVWYFVQISQLWIAVVLAAVLARPVGDTLAERRVLLVISLFLGLYASYVVYAGGDEFSAFPFWRHFVHVFVFIVLAVALAIGMIVPWRPGGTIVTVVLAVVPNALVFTLGPPADGGQGLRDRIRATATSQAKQQEYFDWAGGLATCATVIATSLAGRFPYAVDATFIDMLSLNDTYIAHHGTVDPQGPIDSKTDGAFVIRRKPDIIEAYVRATTIASGDAKSIYRGRAKMVREIIDDPAFQSSYCFAVTAPSHAMDRALFIRRDYAKAHGLTDAECRPVSATVLARPAAAAQTPPAR